VATTFITISGAGRELTEGFGSLLAAAILLFVGIWMHGKAQAGAWQAYVKEKLDRALEPRLELAPVRRSPSSPSTARCSRRSSSSPLWASRATDVELWPAASRRPQWLLGLVAWAMLRFSAKLPIAKFFAYSSVLIAVLAVVLAGKGFGALAGIRDHRRDLRSQASPASSLFGVFPTVQTLAAQAATILLLVLGYFVVHRRQDRPAALGAISSEPLFGDSEIAARLQPWRAGRLGLCDSPGFEEDGMAGVNKVILVGNLGDGPGGPLAQQRRRGGQHARRHVSESMEGQGRQPPGADRVAQRRDLQRESRPGRQDPICARDRRSISRARSRPANGRTSRAPTNIRPRSCCRRFRGELVLLDSRGGGGGGGGYGGGDDYGDSGGNDFGGGAARPQSRPQPAFDSDLDDDVPF
jgi:uncharacterized membrane protein YgcG